MLVSFGVTKHACSLYTMSPGLVKQMKAELRGTEGIRALRCTLRRASRCQRG